MAQLNSLIRLEPFQGAYKGKIARLPFMHSVRRRIAGAMPPSILLRCGIAASIRGDVGGCDMRRTDESLVMPGLARASTRYESFENADDRAFAAPKRLRPRRRDSPAMTAEEAGPSS